MDPTDFAERVPRLGPGRDPGCPRGTQLRDRRQRHGARLDQPRPPGLSPLLQPGQVDALGHHRDRNGHYYVVTPLANSTWRIVLAAPNGPLFASVSGVTGSRG